MIDYITNMAERNKYDYSEAAKKLKREYHRQKLKEFRERNPDYDKQHREANKERYQQAVRKYKSKKRQEDPEHFAKKLKQFRQDNPDKQPEYDKRKWERKAEQMNDTVKDISVTGRAITVTADRGQRICINCGNFYKSIRKTSKYCSDKCRVYYNRHHKV